MTALVSDIAFTAAVKAEQTRRGSRHGYERMEDKGGWSSTITPDLEHFIATRDSFYLSTASADGQPYVQHRGGPPGFVKVLDECTLAFADFRGNRQYITAGNLAENPRAFLFLMDYPNRSHVKIWGRAKVVEDDPALMDRLVDSGYAARPEQAIVFTLEAWDANCPQHITPRFTEAEYEGQLTDLHVRVRELEDELARLRDRH